MKIGITGATGFIGSHLVRHFASNGDKVIAYGRSEKAPAELLKLATYKKWDLTNETFPDIGELDVLIHCAGFVEFWGSYEAMHNLNVNGIKKVMKSAKNVNHFIYISTASVYSPNGMNSAAEDTPYPIKYGNNYARTKSEAEKEIIAYQSKFKKITIIRPHAVYGSGDRHVIPKLLASVKQGRAFIVGNGKNKLSITHVGNICYGISLVIKKQKQHFCIYNIADDTQMTINSIYKDLLKSMKMDVKIYHIPYYLALELGVAFEKLYLLLNKQEQPLLTADIAKQFAHNSTLSLTKIKKDLSYNPPYSYKKGFKDYKEWIDSIGGLEYYLQTQKNDSWRGKLITY